MVYKYNANDDDIEIQEEQEEEEQEMHSTATVWLSGGDRPTLYIPHELAKKHRLDQPCRVAFYDKGKEGVLIRFIHKQKKNNNNGKNHNNQVKRRRKSFLSLMLSMSILVIPMLTNQILLSFN